MEQTLSPELSQPITAFPSDSLRPDQIDPTFANSSLDLVSAPLSPKILHISNEFFALAKNLLAPTPPISRPGVFVATGAWYDGWESRRHNPRPYDHVIIRLGVAAGVVRGVEIDTAFFTGNHAPEISVEGCFEIGEGADGRVIAGEEEEKGGRREEYVGWKTVLGRRKCEPSRRHGWVIGKQEHQGVGARGGEGGGGGGAIASAVGVVAAALGGGGGSAAGAAEVYDGKPITHVRLRMYPDGGIARFRLYGMAVPVWPSSGSPGALPERIELSAAQNGGLATAASDEHYGRASNLLLPGRGVDMGDGWETKRSRTGGHVDWAVVRLGARGAVEKIVVDTMHFRGNFPREVKVSLGDFVENEDGRTNPENVGKMEVPVGEEGWVEAVHCTEMKADTEFEFVEGNGLKESMGGGAWTHAKLTMIPDGGVKRLRIFGTRI